MGFAVKGIGNFGRNVAVIADRYFLFEEMNFPKDSLKKAEIDAMAKLSIESMFPPGNYEIVAGFFVGKGNDSMVVFVASKDRLLSEIPQLASCKYWIPKRFVLECLQNDLSVPGGNGCVILDVDASGFCCIEGKKIALFSDEFWTAEMHDAEAKKASKMAESMGVLLGKAVAPLLSASAGLLLLFVALVAVNFAIGSRLSSMQSNQTNVDRVKERSKLRDEIYAFATGKLAYFKRLQIVNDVRPAEMLFREFSADGSNVAHFLGTCESVSALNEFLSVLGKKKEVADASTANVISKQKETSFNLSVKFL
ncbi:MAG: hypothetical protein LBI61_01505 [Puniceicoccales bacterium]|nr:hypothetical protein [Puniceicoccales bacterium]